MVIHNGRTTVHLPEPEILTREDTEHGRWEVETVPAKRGLPHTNIVEKLMKAPGDSSEMSRTIRAHEMMHAKVSPAGEFKEWIDREIASVGSTQGLRGTAGQPSVPESWLQHDRSICPTTARRLTANGSLPPTTGGGLCL